MISPCWFSSECILHSPLPPMHRHCRGMDPQFFFSAHPGHPHLLCPGPFPPRRAGSSCPDLRGGAAAGSPPDPVPPDIRAAILQPHYLHPHRVHHLPQQCVRRAAAAAAATARRCHLPAALLLSGRGEAGGRMRGRWGALATCVGKMITAALHRPRSCITLIWPPPSPLQNVFVCLLPVHRRTGWRD